MDACSIAEVVDAGRRSFAVCPEALRRLREAKGMTQLQLAEAAGVDPATANQVERGGRRRIRALTLARLADALDVAPGELLVGEEVEDG